MMLPFLFVLFFRCNTASSRRSTIQHHDDIARTSFYFLFCILSTAIASCVGGNIDRSSSFWGVAAAPIYWSPSSPYISEAAGELLFYFVVFLFIRMQYLRLNCHLHCSLSRICRFCCVEYEMNKAID